MFELFKYWKWIQIIQAIEGPWSVYVHTGPGEVNESRAQHFEGSLSFGITHSSYIVNATYDDGAHKLRGEAGVVRLSLREKIQWDGRDVEGDDIYLSLQSGEIQRAIVEFRFLDDGKPVRIRFKKAVEG